MAPESHRELWVLPKRASPKQPRMPLPKAAKTVRGNEVGARR